MSRKTHCVHVRFFPEELERLHFLCNELGMSQSDVVRMALFQIRTDPKSLASAAAEQMTARAGVKVMPKPRRQVEREEKPAVDEATKPRDWGGWSLGI